MYILNIHARFGDQTKIYVDKSYGIIKLGVKLRYMLF